MRRYIKTENEIFFYGSGFSQWYECIIEDPLGNVFRTSEHFMMYHKAKLFNDTQSMEMILKTINPHEVKQIGKEVQNFNEEIWDLYKRDIVTLGNYYKFTQNDRYNILLMDSKDKEIIEASPTDTVWGIGLAVNDNRIHDRSLWNGQNLLGRCIMKVRDVLNLSSVEQYMYVRYLEDRLYK